MLKAAVAEATPLLILLFLPRLGLVLYRSDSSKLAGNLAAFATFELAFTILFVTVTRAAMQRRLLLVLLRAALPLLQVFAIADGIYTTLVGTPLVRIL